MRACLIILGILAASPTAAAEPMDAAQKRCFCVKLSEPGAMPPYFLAKMDWEECKGRKLDFLEGRTIDELGILNCEDLMACLEAPKKEKQIREAALKKVEDITRTLLACCAKDTGDCDKACVSKLEPLLNAAKTDSARLEKKALRRQDVCIARKRPVQPPTGDTDSSPGRPIGAGN